MSLSHENCLFTKDHCSLAENQDQMQAFLVKRPGYNLSLAWEGGPAMFKNSSLGYKNKLLQACQPPIACRITGVWALACSIESVSGELACGES